MTGTSLFKTPSTEPTASAEEHNQTDTLFKPAKAKPISGRQESVQTAFRISPELLGELDALLEEANRRRPWPKMTRSDAFRLVVTRAIKERPEWLLGESEAR